MTLDALTEKIESLLGGRVPHKVDPDDFADTGERRLAEAVNRLIDFTEEIHRFVLPLSRGELDGLHLPPRNFLGSPFKELHSRLLHLTWQARQVARGDYSQRVDFMGEFSEAFNAMVQSLDETKKRLEQKIEDLREALSQIKRLEGILPICSACKKIRLEEGDPYDPAAWISIERYIHGHADVRFTHSICPGCAKELYPDLV